MQQSTRAPSSVEPRKFFKVLGRELDDLLYPVTPKQFLDEYWARQARYIKGPPHKFADLFSIPMFHAAARGAGALHVEFKDGLRLHKAHPEDIDVCFKQGATICLTDISHSNTRVQAVVDAIKRQLQFSGVLDVRSYLSSDGCGYATHADARIATTLQISGKKRWRFAQHPAVDFPLRNIVFGPEGYRVYRFQHDGPTRLWEHFDKPDEASFSEVVLEPGDLLCLPAGTWHSAKAIGHSLAINLAFNSTPFDHFITSAMRERLLTIPEWRCPIPLAPGQPADGTVPDHVAVFFAARLREMKECIEALAPDGPELAHAWRERIYSRTQSASDTAGVLPCNSNPIRPNDRFVRNAFTSFGWSPDEAFKPALTIYEGTRTHTIRLSGQMEPFVRKLMTVDAFHAKDCRRWANEGTRYEWPVVEATLRALINGGLIRREDSRSRESVMHAL